MSPSAAISSGKRLVIHIDADTDDHHLYAVYLSLHLSEYSADFPATDNANHSATLISTSSCVASRSHCAAIVVASVRRGARLGGAFGYRISDTYNPDSGSECHERPSLPFSGCLRFRNHNGSFDNFVSMFQKAQRKGVRGIDSIEVIQRSADGVRVKPRADQLRKQNIRQADQPVTREEFPVNLNACLPEFIDPTRER
jgi:hypothetical protein